MAEAVNKRGVRYVRHFTRLENLPSILKHGLVPRSMLKNGFEPAIIIVADRTR